ncbi:MAG: xanthine dehydrogenase family protein molybdopterin-binding subunit [Alphaproteobacteria bacterium]
MRGPIPRDGKPRSSAGIGADIARVEDERFVLGLGRYIADLSFPSECHAVFVRSPHARADLVAISKDAASVMPGVLAIWTGRDVAAHATTLRVAPAIDGLKPVDLPPFPVDRVRFVGDLVAVVVAETVEQAQAALEAITVDYDETPAVASIADARTGLTVDPGLSTNEISHQTFSAGDMASAFGRAARIVEARFSQGRVTHAPLEPRGLVAMWDPGRKHLTIHGGNQAPHPLRSALAARLGLGEGQVTVISPDMGGGFGQKIALLREELTVAALAIALKRPVRWQEERGENLMAALHAREEDIVTRAAVTADGTILGLEARIEADFGAYCFFPANYMARVVALILPGPYRIPAYSYDVSVWLTNKCPAGPMRAPMASASWIMDGTIDAIARELSLDPVAVRRLNTIRDADLPFTTITGETYVDVTPAATLEAAVTAVDYEACRARQIKATRAGRLLGLGFCTVVESTTYGSQFYRNAGIAGSGHEVATVRVEPSGAVLVSCGLMGSGQGYETTLAQCAAEGLGARLDAISVQIGHTDIAPYGMGSRGARGGTAGGGVVLMAAQRLRTKVLAIAAHRLGLNAADQLALADGEVLREIDGVWTATGLTLPGLARLAHLDPLNLPEGMEPGLHATVAYDPPPITYSNATHACEIEIDPETGTISLKRYVVAHDCGTEINPRVVAGQVHGAVAMGLSGAWMEHCAYDADGQALAGSFMDYAMIRAADLCAIEVIDVNRPNSLTPGGMKGMSEGGVMGAIGALANAINDALGAGRPVVYTQPFTAERLWRALRQ